MYDAFMEYIENIKAQLTNDLLNNAMLRMLPDDGTKDAIHRLLDALNARGVSSKTIADAIIDAIKAGNKDDH